MSGMPGKQARDTDKQATTAFALYHLGHGDSASFPTSCASSMRLDCIISFFLSIELARDSEACLQDNHIHLPLKYRERKAKIILLLYCTDKSFNINFK